MNIAVLVSGGGTNLQALINAEKSGIIKDGSIKAVISSNSTAYAIERAKKEFIPSYIVKRKDYNCAQDYSKALDTLLCQLKIDLVVLAGFMIVLSKDFCKRWENKIINIHPSLIPSFCGEGFYGIGVHKAALEKGVKITGATVHFVSEIVDGGAIIFQKAVEVMPFDTPEILQKRVMEQAEWEILIKAVSLFCQNRLKINGQTVEILPEN